MVAINMAELGALGLAYAEEPSAHQTNRFCCFFSDSPERPLVHFNLADVSDTTTLLLSNDSSTLYVGATNAILLLNVSRSDVISLWGQVSLRVIQVTRLTSCFDTQVLVVSR